MTADRTGAELINTATSWLSERTGLDFSGTRGRWLRAFASSAQGRDGGLLQRLLDGDPKAFGELCAVATVQESYFFREPAMLAFLRDAVLPRLAERPGNLRAWSAGCAGGEEVYTIAILLTTAGLAGRASVLGTDLAEAAVRQACRGVYGNWSMRGVADPDSDRRFRKAGAGFTVDPRRHAPIDFMQHNLLDGPPSAAPFDLVLCRNVLIYLTPDAIRRAGKTLVESLVPGGWLITGVSDPYLDVEGLEQVRTPAGITYRRSVSTGSKASSSVPSPGLAPPPVMTPNEQRPRRTSPPRRSRAAMPATRPRGSWTEDADRALLMAEPQHAAELARAALFTGTDPQRAHALLICALDADNRPAEALAAAERAIEQFPLAAELHGLMSAMLLQAGRAEEAQVMARRARYLDPGAPLAHLVLARASDLLGNPRTARPARRHGHRLLERTVRS